MLLTHFNLTGNVIDTFMQIRKLINIYRCYKILIVQIKYIKLNENI